MKRCFIILSFLCSILLNQDRSTIFNTGSPPDLTNGYRINISNSVANKLMIPDNFVLEAMVFYVTATNEEANSIIVSIREDNNGVPGELVTELAQWNYNVTYPATSGYNLIVTTDLCIYLDSGNHYWWTIQAADEQTQATWIHSNNSLYTYSTTQDEGITWSTQTGYAGAGGVWAEQIYVTEASEGDINSDFTTNVIDIVALVGYILEDYSFTPEQMIIADVNRDGAIDVIDVVSLVNIVLTPPQQSSDFTLEDINPVSEYYGTDIGPSFFSGQVSCYYFGKQG